MIISALGVVGTFTEWYSEDLLKTEAEYHYGSLKTFNHWT